MPVVPILLDDLVGEHPHWWFHALAAIIGDGPDIPEKHRRSLRKQAVDWRAWATERGILAPQDAPKEVKL